MKLEVMPQGHFRRHSRLWVSILACTFLLPLALSAKTETFSGSTSVTVVEIPVQVIDKEGRPVRGLSASDFVVKDGKKKREIVGFEVYDRDEPEPEESLPTAARRHFLFLFDLTFSGPTTILRAREAAVDMLDHLHPTDLVSVATYSRVKGPQLLMAFTTDRRQAELAILSLGAPTLVDGNSDPLQLVLSNVAARTGQGGTFGQSARPEVSGSSGIGGDNPRAESDDGRADLADQAQAYIEEMGARAQRTAKRQEAQDVEIFADSLAGLADLMGAINGRKHVVFLSEGFDGELLRGAEKVDMRTRLAMESGQTFNVDSDQVYGSGSLANRLENMIEEFRRADCVVHSVDISSLREVSLGGNRLEGLTSMAKSTGGELLRNFTDLGRAMDKVLKRTAVTYVLTIQPNDLKADGKYRKLKVELAEKVKGAKIVARPGYFSPSDKPESPMQARLHTASQLLTGRTGGQLNLSVLAVPFQAEGPAALVPVLIEVDGSTLLSNAATGKTMQTEFFAYAINAEGAAVDNFTTVLTLDRGKSEPTLKAGGLKFLGNMHLPAGSYEIRVLVRDAATGASGLQSTPLTVPDFDNGKLAVLPPLVPGSTEQWLLMRLPTPKGQEPEPSPFLIGTNQAFVPVARPVAPSGGVVPLAAFVYNQVGAVTLDAQLLDAAGDVVLGQQLSVSREEEGENGLTRILAGLSLVGVPEGDYTLVLGVAEAERGARELSTIPFKVEGALEGVAGSEAVAKRKAKAERKQEMRKRQRTLLGELQAQYREALAALAEGHDETAKDRLIRLESTFAEKSKDVELSLLRSALMEVANRDLARHADALIPVAEMHFEVYQRYLRERKMLLALHSRMMVQELARLYQSRGEPPQSLELAARVLTTLGGALQQAGATSSANTLFDEVLDFSPGDEAALLGLSAYHEKMGNYEKARDYLEQLVETNPQNAEGWLRYGLNLRRCEKVDQARQWIDKARQESAPPWIRSLAFQELARLETSSGNLERAEEVLRQGVEALPGEQRLYLQLAMVLDRTGHRAESSELIQKVTELPSSGESPRYLYNRWPRSVIELGRKQLKETAAQRRSVLARAMADSQPNGGGR